MATFDVKWRRRFVGLFALQSGRGGVQLVPEIIGFSRMTMRIGQQEIIRTDRTPGVRRWGAGRLGPCRRWPCRPASPASLDGLARHQAMWRAEDEAFADHGQRLAYNDVVAFALDNANT